MMILNEREKSIKPVQGWLINTIIAFKRNVWEKMCKCLYQMISRSFKEREREKREYMERKKTLNFFFDAHITLLKNR